MERVLIIEIGDRSMSAVSASDRRAAFERGRARWPSLGLRYEQFAAHLDRLGWGHQLPAQVEEFYLCAGCSLSLEPACRALDHTYFGRLEQELLQRYKSADFVADVLQLTRERLLVRPGLRIATYRGAGCLQSWLRVIGRRVAVDLQRSEAAHRRHALAEWQRCSALAVPGVWAGEVQRGAALNPAWIESLERAVQEAAFALDPADRGLLYRFYASGEQVADIGARLGVDRSTVYRRLEAARRRLSSSVRKAASARADLLIRDDLEGLLRSSCAALELDFELWRTSGEVGTATRSWAASRRCAALKSAAIGVAARSGHRGASPLT